MCASLMQSHHVCAAKQYQVPLLGMTTRTRRPSLVTCRTGSSQFITVGFKFEPKPLRHVRDVHFCCECDEIAIAGPNWRASASALFLFDEEAVPEVKALSAGGVRDRGGPSPFLEGCPAFFTCSPNCQQVQRPGREPSGSVSAGRNEAPTNGRSCPPAPVLRPALTSTTRARPRSARTRSHLEARYRRDALPQ